MNDTPHRYKIIDIDLRRPVPTGHDDEKKEGFDPTISSILSCSDAVRSYIRTDGSSDNAFDRVEKNIPQNGQAANCIKREMLTIRIKIDYYSVNLPHCYWSWRGGVLADNGITHEVPFYTDSVLHIDPDVTLSPQARILALFVDYHIFHKPFLHSLVDMSVVYGYIARESCFNRCRMFVLVDCRLQIVH